MAGVGVLPAMPARAARPYSEDDFLSSRHDLRMQPGKEPPRQLKVRGGTNHLNPVNPEHYSAELPASRGYLQPCREYST